MTDHRESITEVLGEINITPEIFSKTVQNMYSLVQETLTLDMFIEALICEARRIDMSEKTKLAYNRVALDFASKDYDLVMKALRNDADNQYAILLKNMATQ